MRRPAHVGFTLVEMLTAAVVVVLIGGVVGSLFVASSRIWERTSTQSKAFPSGYIALSRIAKDIRQSGYLTVPVLDPLPSLWETGEEYAEDVYVTDDQGLIFRCVAAHIAGDEPPSVTPTLWAPLRSDIVMYDAKRKTDPTTGEVVTWTFDAGDITKDVVPIQTPMELETDDVTQYYLSDETGDYGVGDGTVLWSRRFSQDYESGSAEELSRQMIAENVNSLAFNLAQHGATGKQVWISSLTLEVVGHVDGKEKNSEYRNFTTKFSTGIAIKNPSVAHIPARPEFE